MSLTYLSECLSFFINLLFYCLIFITKIQKFTKNVKYVEMRKDKDENFNRSLVAVPGIRYWYKNTKIQTCVIKNIVCTKG